MKYALSFFFCFASIICLAQNNLKDVGFINSVFKAPDAAKIVYYVDKPEIWDNDEINILLNKDTLRFNNSVSHKPDLFVFSKAEKEFILQSYQTQRDMKWGNGLIPNSKMISADTIHAILETRDINKDWPYFYKMYPGNGYYSFLKPIFIRNNTVCIFYVTHSCGHLCADGKADIYFKMNEKWVSVYTFFRWQS